MQVQVSVQTQAGNRLVAWLPDAVRSARVVGIWPDPLLLTRRSAGGTQIPRVSSTVRHCVVGQTRDIGTAVDRYIKRGTFAKGTQDKLEEMKTSSSHHVILSLIDS